MAESEGEGLRKEDIQARAQGLVDLDSERDTRFTELEEMYLTVDPKAPQTQRDYTTLSLRPHNAVSMIQDMLCSAPAQVVVNEGEESEQAKKESERVRLALEAILYRCEEEQDDVVAQIVGQASIFGVSVLKVLDRRRALVFAGKTKKEIDDYLVDHSPFSIVPVHPSSVHVLRYDDEIAYVVEKSRRSVGWVKTMFGGKVREAKGLSNDEKLELNYWEYWDHEWQYVWTDGAAGGMDLIGPIRHQAVLPYCVRNVRPSRFLSRRDREGSSLLGPLCDSKIWKRQNMLRTVLANNAVASATPGMVSKTHSGIGPAVDWTVPNSMVEMKVGESFEPVAPPKVSEAVSALFPLLEADEEAALLPRVVAGQGPSGVTAGFAINLLSQSGRTKVMPIQRAAQRCLSDALIKCCKLAEKWAEPVPVWGKKGLATLKPEDLGGHYRIDVNLTARLPQDKGADLQVAQAAKSSELMSDETIQETILEVSSEQETERIWMQRFRQIVDPVHMLAVARKKGYIKNDDDENLVRTALKLPLLGQESGPSGPPSQPVPGGPLAGTGTPGGPGMQAGAMPPSGMVDLPGPMGAAGAGEPMGTPGQPGGMVDLPGPMGAMGPTGAGGAPGGLPPGMESLPPEVLAALMAQMAGQGVPGRAQEAQVGKSILMDESLAERAMALPERFAKALPEHPDVLSEYQKWRRFVKNPQIVNTLVPAERGGFVEEMRRLHAKYGLAGGQ